MHSNKQLVYQIRIINNIKYQSSHMHTHKHTHTQTHAHTHTHTHTQKIGYVAPLIFY